VTGVGELWAAVGGRGSGGQRVDRASACCPRGLYLRRRCGLGRGPCMLCIRPFGASLALLYHSLAALWPPSSTLRQSLTSRPRPMVAQSRA
jgi:hypothetical protein